MQLSPMQICVSRFDGLDAAIRNCASSSFAEHRVVFVKNDMVQDMRGPNVEMPNLFYHCLGCWLKIESDMI